MSNDFDFNFDDILSEFDADASNSVRSDEYEEDEYESVEIPSPRTGARVSGGHLCEAEAPTEPAGETGDHLRWMRTRRSRWDRGDGEA